MLICMDQHNIAEFRLSQLIHFFVSAKETKRKLKWLLKLSFSLHIISSVEIESSDASQMPKQVSQECSVKLLLV